MGPQNIIIDTAYLNRLISAYRDLQESLIIINGWGGIENESYAQALVQETLTLGNGSRATDTYVAIRDLNRQIRDTKHVAKELRSRVAEVTELLQVYLNAVRANEDPTGLYEGMTAVQWLDLEGSIMDSQNGGRLVLPKMTPGLNAFGETDSSKSYSIQIGPLGVEGSYTIEVQYLPDGTALITKNEVTSAVVDLKKGQGGATQIESTTYHVSAFDIDRMLKYLEGDGPLPGGGDPNTAIVGKSTQLGAFVRASIGGSFNTAGLSASGSATVEAGGGVYQGTASDGQTVTGTYGEVKLDAQASLHALGGAVDLEGKVNADVRAVAGMESNGTLYIGLSGTLQVEGTATINGHSYSVAPPYNSLRVTFDTSFNTSQLSAEIQKDLTSKDPNSILSGIEKAAAQGFKFDYQVWEGMSSTSTSDFLVGSTTNQDEGWVRLP